MTHKGPLLVTLVYVLIYYSFQMYQLAVKNRLSKEYKARGEKFDRYFGNDRQMLAVDRYVLNTLEHMPPFLTLLWLTAIYVNDTQAVIPGTLYLLTRAVYPFLVGKEMGRNVAGRVMYATFLGYGVLTYWAVLLVKGLVQ
jgi:hypothetical protein